MNKATINKSIVHLSKDQILKKIIDKYDPPKFTASSNYFNSLSKIIIYQQLSIKSANVIYERFLSNFDNHVADSWSFNKIDKEKLKQDGLSKQKISYICNLSTFFNKNEFFFDDKHLSEEVIRKKLLSIKGIGPWTVDMFMIFTLYKQDILPIHDLAIKKAFKIIYNLKSLPTNDFMIKKARLWIPYRSIASCYLWKITDDGVGW